MKKLLALVSSALLASSVFAQGGGSDKHHMVEFNAEDLLQLTLAFDRSKSKGLPSDNDTQLDLNLNYAYALPMHPRLQVGTKVNYNKGTESGRGDFEDYGLDVGGYYNFSGWNRTDPVDLMNSAYIGAFVGIEWAQIYGSAGGKDEAWRAEVALGKRWDLSRWNVSQLSYTPEVAFVNENSTTGASLEYSQSVQFRFIQFSLFW